MAAPADREKALDTALAQIERAYGKGSVMRLGEEARAPVEIIPTGAISLDVALGIGGLPRGRVVEMYGPESSGKTTVALHAVANAQKAGGVAGFIDAEHALDPRRRPAGWPASSTPSTHWTRSMPRRWALIPMRCWCPSLTPVSRRWRSRTR